MGHSLAINPDNICANRVGRETLIAGKLLGSTADSQAVPRAVFERSKDFDRACLG